ncbi:MAG: serine/threonine protein kinase [Planctomycetes bacterium]|nr:serine/threonine protein kinase [Planctomycetota bacterium]
MTFAQPFTDYEILDRVGAGAMGTVFKARHKRLNRIVALKVLKPSLARDARYVDRLRREARIVASLSHPNIVTGYDLGEEGGYHFFVMEFVEGKSLRALLAEWGLFAEEYVRRVAREVAQALDHAYQRGVIHRDVKPGNILIDEQGRVKLTDMGLAKGPADLTLTRDGATVGTPQYISPEQARNPQDVDVRSDLYSLGATLYHMATGVPPFRGDTVAELITRLLHEAPVPPIERNPALSEGLSLVIRKLLAKDLRVRYQTPRELLDDLDRLEAAQPPAVDVSRLSAGEATASRWWWRSLGVVVAAGLLALALWIGMQLRGREPEPPTAEEYLAQLDAALRDLPTPAARLQRLRLPGAAPPPGCEVGLLQRERRVVSELQAALDAELAAVQGEAWGELLAWSRDPLVWPDRFRFERERLGPRLLAATGLVLGQLPPQLRTLRLDELSLRWDRELEQRDQALLRRFEHFLAAPLAARADERVRVGDFAGAERIWREAVAAFFDGVHQPLLERLAGPIAQRAVELHAQAGHGALAELDAAEATIAAAMRGEVEEVTAGILARLQAGEDVDHAASALARLRHDLNQVWPASSRFRLGRDPWPEIERRLAVAQHALAAANTRAASQGFERRCDLAWRAYFHGSAVDALDVLVGAAPSSAAQAEALRRHRQTLEAARAVEAAVLQAIARSTAPVLAFPRRGPAAAEELHAQPSGEGFRLERQRLGEPPRPARLVEFRFSELLARLRQQGGEPLRAVPAGQQAVGTAVLALGSDDLAGIGALLQQIEVDGSRFLADEVWPRLLRVRGEQPETDLDRQTLLAAVRRAREMAADNGSLTELEAAILSFQTRVPNAELADSERQEVRSAVAWLQQERRRRNLVAELLANAPPGAQSRVAVVGDQLEAEVALPGPALLHGAAAEGWRARADAAEFAGGAVAWRDLPLQALRCRSGLDGTATRAVLDLDLVLPAAGVGRRLYVIEFRGIAVLLAITADDAAYAALVHGDPLREDLAQRAFQRALLGALQPARCLVLPGAVHQLRLDVAASTTRRRATVRVELDGAVLVAGELHDLQPQLGLDATLYARQEIAVRRLVVRASAL